MEEIIEEDSLEVAHKPHFLIEISNKVTLHQRKAFNVMLKNARPLLKETNVYSMRLSELAPFVRRKNDACFKEMLRAIRRIEVEWNILDRADGVKVKKEDEVKKEETEWVNTSLCSEVKISGNRIVYEFSTSMRQMLMKNPRYASLDLEIQKNLLTKHGQALWEFAHEFIGTGSTGWCPLDEIRTMFATGKRYEKFKYFKYEVINKALLDVNKNSDIHVGAEYDAQGRGKTITHVRFKVRWKSPEKPKKIQKDPLPSSLSWFETLTKKDQEVLMDVFDQKCAETGRLREIQWQEFLRENRDKKIVQGAFNIP